jgi:hypothetical protein
MSLIFFGKHSRPAKLKDNGPEHIPSMDHSKIIDRLRGLLSVRSLTSIHVTTFYTLPTCYRQCSIIAIIASHGQVICSINSPHCDRCALAFCPAMPPTYTFLQRHALVPKLPRREKVYGCFCCYRSLHKLQTTDGACAACLARHEMEIGQLSCAIFLCKKYVNQDVARMVAVRLALML